MPMLHHSAIVGLHRAAIETRLDQSRLALLSGLPPQIVSGLTTSPRPAEQTLHDLSALNDIGTLPDGTCPLAVWLRNALSLLELRYDPHPFSLILFDLQARDLDQWPVNGEDSPLSLADIVYGHWLVELRTRNKCQSLLRLSIREEGQLLSRRLTPGASDTPGVGTWQLSRTNEITIRLSGTVSSHFTTRVQISTCSKNYLHGRSGSGETLFWTRLNSFD